jgi:hypothetical protein
MGQLFAWLDDGFRMPGQTPRPIQLGFSHAIIRNAFA